MSEGVRQSALWIIGAVLLICLLLGLLPLLLDVLGVAVRVFVIVPVVGTVLGLFIAAIIHRYILPLGSRHRGRGAALLLLSLQKYPKDLRSRP